MPMILYSTEIHSIAVVLHFPTSDLQSLVVLRFPVKIFRLFFFFWSSFLQTSIFSQPQMDQRLWCKRWRVSVSEQGQCMELKVVNLCS